ncbi:MAG: hypothetical protein IT428_23950 [Planctomycetaceae bacterium]|nr:hypothetical protein [Planctomycetaceae bacterium]
MRRVFLGNFQFEHELAGHAATANERLSELSHRLAFAWILVAEPGDIVVLPERFEAGFLARLRHAGLPRIIPWSKVAGLRLAGAVELVPWGWSDAPREFARRYGLAMTAPPLDAVRGVNSRRFSLQCEADAGIGLPGAAAPTTLEEVADCLRGLPAAAGWVIKAEVGMSARERILGRGPVLSAPAEGWIRKRLARDGVVFFEPWVERIEEAGIQFDIPSVGPPQCVGVTGLLTDESGAYVGTRFDRDAGLESRFDEAVSHGLRAAERAQAAGYFGPMGIDAMRYRREDGSIAVRALQDINGRWTMGRLSLGARRWLRSGERGEWIQNVLRTAHEPREEFWALTEGQPSGVRLVRTSPWEIEGRAPLGVSALRFLPGDMALSESS